MTSKKIRVFPPAISNYSGLLLRQYRTHIVIETKDGFAAKLTQEIDSERSKHCLDERFNVRNDSLPGQHGKLVFQDTLVNGAQRTEPVTSPSNTEDEVLLDLAIRHFRDLKLQSAEPRQLAAGILQAAATGEPHFVGPVGESSRRYEFHRRLAALSIRVGEGRISLPLQSALCLANALQGAREPQLIGAIAA